MPASPPDAPARLAALCRRLAASEREALGELFVWLRPPLVRYAHSFVRDGAAAHDLVQDVFVMLWDMRDSLDPAQSVRALLYRMTRNRALNHERARRVRFDKRDEVRDRTPTTTVPDLGLDLAALTHHLQAWLDDLPPRQQEALTLTRLQGLSHEEAAAVMDISPRTVNNHIVRGLARLHERLAAFDPNYT